jgi:CelD/BcsL family acetyltransferase involved in cellulose biosynthesis
MERGVTDLGPCDTMQATVIDDVDMSPADIAAWDRLAVDNDQPYASPEWCLAWWRHVAPRSAALRIVLVHNMDGLVAVAPFYCEPGRLGIARYRMLGAGISPSLQPLSERRTEEAAAVEITAALARSRPRPAAIEFDGIECDSRWPGLLAAAWPDHRAWLQYEPPIDAPAVTLEGDFEHWLRSKSRNFRQQTRRHRRRLYDKGATFRIATDVADVRARLPDFERLHQARWHYRGGSRALDRHVMDMLQQVAGTMTPSARLQLHLIEHEQGVIAAHVFLTAGRRMAYWLGGFDEDWAEDQPSMQAIIDAMAHAFETDHEVFDLGPGAQAYKARLSDHARTMCRVTLYPPGPRRIVAITVGLPGRLADTARNRFFAALSTERKDQIKRWLRQLRA